MKSFLFFLPFHTGVVVETTRMDLGSSVEINEGVNELEFDVTISSMGGGADARGEGLWKMKTFTTTDYTGKSGRNLLDEQSLTQQQAGQDMMAGSRTTFRNLAATINKEQVSCSEDTYLCVELSRGDRPSKDFSMNPAYEDSYLSCERLKCAKRAADRKNMYTNKNMFYARFALIELRLTIMLRSIGVVRKRVENEVRRRARGN